MRSGTFRPIVLCSGGFDPPHVGHVRYLRGAAHVGRVIVALNSDAWLLRKKGYISMPWKERKEMLESFRFVEKVIPVRDTDDSVTAALYAVKPHFFANGGDVTPRKTREAEACRILGIKMLHGIGGSKKLRSSSEWVLRK